MLNPHEENELRSFLLGTIKHEKQRRKIEMRLMVDDDYFHFLEMLEDELIQEFADNELNESERNQFENNFFLSNERMEKLKFAYIFRAFINTINKKEN